MKLQAKGKTTWFVYQKIIIVFIVVLIPLILMNIWVNYKGMSYTKNVVLDSSLAGATFYAKQLDKELYAIRNQQIQIMDFEDVQKLSFLSGSLGPYEEVELIERVRNRLASIMNSSEYVINAGVYVKAAGKTISNYSGVTNTPNVEYQLIASLLETTPKPYFYQVGDRIFFIETANNEGIWSYIEISRLKLLDALHQISSLYPKSEVILGNETLGSVLSTTQDQDKQAHALEQLLLGEQDSNVENAPEFKNVGGIKYFVTHNAVSSLDLSLMMYVNQNEIIRPLNQFNMLFYLLIGVAFVMLLLYTYSINLMIHRPMSRLVKAFQMIETNNLNIVIESKSKDEFHYLFQSFNRMSQRLKRSIEENYEQKMALQHSELKQLQSQINPHFLYNSFFNIYMMCKMGDSDSAAELSQKLGSYYQYITRSGSDEVLLSKEIQHALDYCEIQSIRFSNRISYDYIGTKAVLQGVYVPRLIIQPIVENVFEHAFEDGKTEGSIHIGSDYQDGIVRITVEDNGNLLTDEHIEQLREKLAVNSRQDEKTGLLNVNNRLQLKYGEGSGVFVARSPNGGLRAELIIQIKGMGD